MEEQEMHYLGRTDFLSPMGLNIPFAEAMEALPYAIWIADSSGQIVYCNSAFERFYACRREEVIGIRETDTFCWEEDWRTRVDHALNSGAAQIWEVERRDAAGDCRVLEICAKLIDQASGLSLRFQTDLTAMRETKCGLERVRQSMELVADMAMIVECENLSVIEVNERALIELGYPRRALHGMRITDLFPQLTDEDFRSVVREARAARGGRRCVRGLTLRQSGEVFASEMQVRVTPEQDDYVALRVHDVTQTLRTESELRQTNRDLALVSSINKAIVGSESERHLLEWVCGILEGSSDYLAAYARIRLDDAITDYSLPGKERDLVAAMRELGLGDDLLEKALRCECAPALYRAKPHLMRVKDRLPRWVKPSVQLAVYLPLRYEKRVLGGLFLIVSLNEIGIEERLERLQAVADDVAFGISTQRHAVASRQAEAIAARRLRVERAVAQYSNDLLIGDDHVAGVRTGMGRLLQAVGADQVFLYECPDSISIGHGARKFCDVNRDGAKRQVSLPERIELKYASAEALEMSHDEWSSALGVELEDRDELLAFPLVAGDRCYGLVGYLFFGDRSVIDGVTVSLLGFASHFMSELHERSRVDRRLRLLAAAMDSTDEGILITDASGGGFTQSPIVLVNEGVCRMSGYSKEQLLGLFPSVLLADGTWRVDEPRLNRDGEPGRGKAKFGRSDGSKFLVEYTVYPIYTSGGAVSQYICIYRDITKREQLESRVAFSNKMESVGQLSAGIAHEINTPAQFIGDNLSFLRDAWERLKPSLEVLGQRNDEPASRRIQRLIAGIPGAIDDACEGVERISTIVKAMREFSHPEKRFSLADLNRCISTTVTVARNEWKYVAELELDLDESLGAVEIRPGDINQVLLNLIVNAAHAIGENIKDGDMGRILISTRSAGDRVRVSVSDTGNGIPEDVRESVFDPFFTTKEVGKGTGQGLFMAHSIIEQRHGGRLWLESEVGVGTTFFFEIPMRRKGATNGEN